MAGSMNPAKPRNAFSLSFEHMDDQPPDPLSRRLVIFFGVSILLSAFPALDLGAIGDFLAAPLAH